RRPPLPRDRVSSIRPETYCEPERRGLRREAQRGVVAVALDHQLVAEQQLRAARKLHRVGGGDVSCLKGVDCGEVETEAAWYQSQFVVKAAVWASYQSEHRHGKLRAQPTTSTGCLYCDQRTDGRAVQRVAHDIGARGDCQVTEDCAALGKRGAEQPTRAVPTGDDPACVFDIDPASRELLPRSEEHTSELQSRFDIVCRLLVEKKK